jgi:hypothetical protein
MNLGIYFDSFLNWGSHINHIIITIFFKLRKLYQIKNLLPESARLKLVRSLILPNLYYGDVIFFSASRTTLKKLE